MDGLNWWKEISVGLVKTTLDGKESDVTGMEEGSNVDTCVLACR